MTTHQFERSLKAVDYLRNGAPSFQSDKLPGCFVRNANNAITHGLAVTENIATWIREGYAAGPFDSPPCANFRVNPIIAVVQPGKVRPVLNVSSPDGASYNSNVDETCTEKVKMSSAKQFGQNLKDCGKGAIMSKHDLVAAYKQIPCKIEDLRLQGFCWLGKFFVETRQIFGAKTSVCNYDILGETLKLLALLESDIPHHLVLRQVDDVPSSSPAGSGWCEDFSLKYKQLCTSLNVGLAPSCPLNDKAFENQVRGKVLGVMFDSTDLTWRLSDKKTDKSVTSIVQALDNHTTTLKEWQRLMGRLSDISQMCKFMKIFKQPINELVAGIATDAPGDMLIEISVQAKKDLLIWAGFLCSKFKWLPIESTDLQPPIWCKEFVSDAAGLADTADFRTSPGCGNVGFSEDGQIIFANQLFWPKKFITDSVDGKGVRFGDKTTTLETIGLLIPFLLVPSEFIQQHVILKVDCFGTIFGMQNRFSSGDSSASVFIRAIYLIAAYLECTVHVMHLPRMSDWGAEVADRLSRSASTTMQDKKLIKAFNNRPIPACLRDWFANPVSDWSLAIHLLEHVKKLV